MSVNRQYFLSFLFPQVLFKASSIYNGTVTVVEQFGRREVLAGGLQQSGDLVRELWEAGIKKISNNNQIATILILGLGGGSVIPVLQKYYPRAYIVAVEIDPVMVHVAKTYFHIGKRKNLIILTTDAFQFLKKKTTPRFDLIIVDLFSGDRETQGIAGAAFLNSLNGKLSARGTVIINHLKNRKNAAKLIRYREELKKVFVTVKEVNPLVNRLYICRKICE